MPATPPPTTTTLGIAQPIEHLGDVDVALDLQVGQVDAADAETLEAVEPGPVGMGGHERRRGIEGGPPAELAGRHLGVPVRPEIEDAPGPVEDERSVGGLVGGA